MLAVILVSDFFLFFSLKEFFGEYLSREFSFEGVLVEAECFRIVIQAVLVKEELLLEGVLNLSKGFLLQEVLWGVFVKGVSLFP